MKRAIGSVKLRQCCVCLFFVLCLILERSALSQEGVSPTSAICSIAQIPEKFDNKIVTVKARVLSDGVHGSVIYDDSCGEFGIHLSILPDSKGVGEFVAALNWCHRSTRGKLLFGTFTGVFHFKPGSPPGHSISVQRIDELVLKSTKTASATFPTPCPDAPPVNTLVHEGDHADPPKPH